MDDINTLRRILKENRVLAVVGLSAQLAPAELLRREVHAGARLPGDPGQPAIQGGARAEVLRKSLRDIPEKVDLVDVFRKTADVLPVARDAIAIGAKVLWQQLGVKNEEAAALAREAGLESVMDRCVKIEHGRLFGGLNWVGVNTRVISAKRPRWLAY